MSDFMIVGAALVSLGVGIGVGALFNVGSTNYA